jgi:hypothetical protein
VKTGLNPTKPVRIKVVSAADQIKVYLNNQSSPCIDVHDSTYSDGFIGFETFNVRASFGALSVRTGV